MRVFHYFHHPFWGTTNFWNPPYKHPKRWWFSRGFPTFPAALRTRRILGDLMPSERSKGDSPTSKHDQRFDARWKQMFRDSLLRAFRYDKICMQPIGLMDVWDIHIYIYYLHGCMRYTYIYIHYHTLPNLKISCVNIKWIEMKHSCRKSHTSGFYGWNSWMDILYNIHIYIYLYLYLLDTL